MSAFKLPLGQLVRENLSIVLCYAYSARPLWAEILARMPGKERFALEIFLLADRRAQKALMELALFLRTLDDDEGITARLRHTDTNLSCGTLYMESGMQEELPLREVANKIIHAKSLDWRITLRDDGDSIKEDALPTVVAIARKHSAQTPKKYRWAEAHIDLIVLGFMCSQIKLP